MTRRIETEDSLLDDDVFEPEQCAGSPQGGASSAPSRSERTSSAASGSGHDGKPYSSGVRISVGSEVEDVIHKVSDRGGRTPTPPSMFNLCCAVSVCVCLGEINVLLDFRQFAESNTIRR